ncbi:MAG: RagB/SusD family nutrient uptake outer membrane protein [Bacteroidota bacterium]
MNSFFNKFFKIKYSFFLVAVLWSCDLDEELLDSSTGDDLIEQVSEELVNNPEGAATPVLNNILAVINFYNNQDNLLALQQHTSDEMIGPTRGTDWDDGGVWRVMHTHEWDANHPYVLNAWNSMNTGIARSFDALNTFNTAAETSGSDVLDPFIAEVRYLRAFFMYQLVDLFGQVPSLNEDDEPIVLSRTEATAFVISELEEIILQLRASSEVGTNRPTVASANVLLARTLLNRNIYDNAPTNNEDLSAVVAACDAIINSGEFSLASNYFDMFAPDNSENASASAEAIWVLPNSESLDNGPSASRWNMTLHYNHDLGSQVLMDAGADAPWNGFATIAEFYNAWDADGNPSNGVSTTDIRFQDESLRDEIGSNLGFLIGQATDADGNPVDDRNGIPLIYTVDVPIAGANESQGVRVVKYRPDPDAAVDDLADNDFIIMRYADVILMKAEAQWRLGNDGDAIVLINQLREARNANPISSISGDGSEILAERGFELYWENYRRTDQIRFGTFLNSYSEKPNVSPANRLVFTIPQVALDVNPNLQPNPGQE